MPYAAKDSGKLIGGRYFGNLGGKGTLEPGSKLGAAIALRGIGWTILHQDVAGGRLINQWINEHAFMIDCGLKRADYVAAFMKNVDWKAAEARLS